MYIIPEDKRAVIDIWAEKSSVSGDAEYIHVHVCIERLNSAETMATTSVRQCRT